MVLTDWHDLLHVADGYLTRPGAVEDDVADLPFQLQRLYLVSDGVYDRHGQWFLLWPLSELLRRNELEWADGDPGRCELLAFGDDGTGAQFCVPRDGGSGVFLWDPLAGSPHWLANDLGDFWAGWTTGAITTYAA